MENVAELAPRADRHPESRPGLPPRQAAAAESRPARPLSQAPGGVNVNDTERTISALAGGALMLLGLSRRSLGGVAVAALGGGLLYRGLTGHCSMYHALGVDTAGREQQAGAPPEATEVKRVLTIGKPADELYRLWNDPQTLPRIMGFFADVTVQGRDAHWSTPNLMGGRLEWDTRVVEERPGELIRWESLPGAGLPSEGRVSFRPAPAGKGTEATLGVRFDPPGGIIGDAAMKFLGFVPRLMAEKALYYFRSLALTGEVPTTAHQPAARTDTR